MPQLDTTFIPHEPLTFPCGAVPNSPDRRSAVGVGHFGSERDEEQAQEGTTAPLRKGRDEGISGQGGARRRAAQHAQLLAYEVVRACMHLALD